MPMKMGWRWYGEGNDPISLSDIKQIPGVTSIVWALHDKMPGEIWEIDEIQKVADQIHAYGFDMDVVESVNVHDDIKIGLPTRDKYIENYKQCICNLSKFGVKVICYNFMPVFDWTRTDLFHPVGDGSTALFYEKDKIKGDYKAMAEYIMSFTEKYNMTFPGWEPERMAKLDELFKAYAPVTKEKLWENLKYFLEALMPTCHECGIIGGISFVLYGMISAIGVRNVVENRVDFTNSRNLIVAAVILVCALGFNSVGGVSFAVAGVTINLSGLAVAAIAGILLNAILPGNDYEFDAADGSEAATSSNLQV